MAKDRPDVMQQTIERIVRDRLNELYEEEVQKAAANVKRRLKKELGQIAASILTHYEMERGADYLVIRVKNEVGE